MNVFRKGSSENTAARIIAGRRNAYAFIVSLYFTLANLSKIKVKINRKYMLISFNIIKYFTNINLT